MKILCTICARKGSKGLKKKNFLKINGRSLVKHTYDQAKKSNIFDNIIISTDSFTLGRQISYDKNSSWFLRSKKLSGPLIGKIDVIKNALEYSELFFQTKYDLIFDLDVTSPLRGIKDIKKSLIQFNKNKSSTLITGCVSYKNPYFNMIEYSKNKKIKLVKNLKKIPNSRQAAPVTYDMNSAIYIWKRTELMNKRILTNRTTLYLMKDYQRFDIDNLLDFKINKFLIKEYNQMFNN